MFSLLKQVLATKLNLRARSLTRSPPRRFWSELVFFGTLKLPHVLELQTVKSRVSIERDIPYSRVAYHADDRDIGQTITLIGEIRETAIDQAYLQIERIRRLNDGVARTLDLEDNVTPTFNAKLGTIEANWTAEDGLERVSYQAAFYETS
jgi:hypothetical protein